MPITQSKIFSETDLELANTTIQDILASPNPSEKLFEKITEFNQPKTQNLCRVIFESVFTQIDIKNYWVFYNMARVYLDLDDPTGGFFVASLGIKMLPDAPSWHMYRLLFHYYLDRGLVDDALQILAQQLKKTPENPVVWSGKIDEFTKAAKRPLPDILLPQQTGALPASRIDVTVTNQSVFLLGSIPHYGAGVPYCLAELEKGLVRQPIEITEITDGNLLISGDALVARDQSGYIHEDISISRFPSILAHKILDLPPEEIENRTFDAVVCLNDSFPATNLCHFLLDQISRLALYERAGVSLEQCAVVGPPIRAEFQREIVKAFKIKHYIGSDKISHVEAKHLYVSSSCKRHHSHPAHFGAEWAMDFIRSGFPSRTSPTGRKLFLSRADANVRFVANEADVWALLQKYGFEMIVPGRMPYTDQVEAFQNASHVVGLHGAALTNIIFCEKSTRVLEIFHPMYGTSAYAIVASSLGLQYASFVAKDADFDDPNSNDPTRLASSQRSFADRSVRVDLAELARWVTDSAA